ncbi:protein phosphatase 2 (formerly 2A) regulatory subunit B'', partial [Clonorchis sinensis]
HRFLWLHMKGEPNKTGVIMQSDAAVASITDEDELFKHYYTAWGGKESTVPEEEQLPDFFHRIPQDHEVLPQKLRQEARATILERKSHELMGEEELQNLWLILDKYRSAPDADGKKYITYENFKKAGREASPKAKSYFTASLYAKLVEPEERLCRIEILSFYNHVVKKVWLQQARIGISLYDVTGEGYLREMDLENYILELLPSLCQLSQLEPSFHVFYVCTAVRKFFFFLDPLRAGRVRITDILASTYLDSLLELREPQTTEAQLASNWFSHQSAMRVYGSYLQLDEDRNGMLTRAELSSCRHPVFIIIIIKDSNISVNTDASLPYNHKDYKSYLDFVLAMEDKHEPQALAYLFRILDVGGRGRLTPLTIKYFYDSLEERLRSSGYTPPTFNDILNEIFDMVKPANPNYITLDDLLRSGKGDTVVSVLTDLQGFWAHENREMLMSELSDEAEL